MREFFRGRRRKVGVVTLLMACMFTTGWVRSFGRQETIHICPWRSVFVVVSSDGNVGFAQCCYDTHDVAISKSITLFRSSLKRFNVGWSTENILELHNQGEWWTGSQSEWHWKLNGFCVGQASHTTQSDEHDVSHLMFPYWSIVILLTALSAFLLLSKPRPSTQKKTPEPIAPKVD